MAKSIGKSSCAALGLTWASDMFVSLKNLGKGGGAEVERASRMTVLFMVDMDNE